MRKTVKWLCIVPVLALLAAGIGAIWLVSHGFHHGIRLFTLTRDYINAPDSDQSLTLEIADARLTADTFWTESEGGRVLCIRAEEIPFYLQDQMLVLDNGRAYSLPQWQPGKEELRKLVTAALLYGEITAEGDAIHLRLNEPSLNLTVIARNGMLSELSIHTTASINGNMIPLHLQIRTVAATDHSIPQEILQTLTQAEPNPLEQPLWPLVTAASDLIGREQITGDLSLAIDCGILQLSEELSMRYVPAKGTITLTRGDIDIPLSTSDSATGFSPSALPLLLLRNASFELNGEAAECTLHLNPEMVRSLCCQLVPQLESADLQFQETVARVMIRSGHLESIHLTGGGDIPFLVTTIPITITMHCVIT